MIINQISNRFWWQTKITIPWPIEVHVIGKHQGEDIRVTTEGDHPTRSIKPWLERNVGKKGIDWDWEFIGRRYLQRSIIIKLRPGISNAATLISLRWT